MLFKASLMYSVMKVSNSC